MEVRYVTAGVRLAGVDDTKVLADGWSSRVSPPPWPVTLVCGASGAGKSRAASALAVRYGVPLGEADDVVTALMAMTTPQQQPVLHYWSTHPEAMAWPPERIADLHLDVAAALRPGFL